MGNITQHSPEMPVSSPPETTSIASRLFRLIFGSYFIVTLLVTCIQLIAEYRNTETRVTAEIKAMQRTFGPGIAHAMWGYEDDVLLGILRGIKELPNVVGVTIEDEKGKLLHATGMIQDKNGANLFADADGRLSSVKESEPLFGKSFSQQFPIVFSDENGQQRTIGKWTVYSNQRVIVRQVQYGFFLILVNSVVKTIALWFIFLFVVKRWLGTPLTQLTRFVQELKLDNLGDRVFVLKDRKRHELHFLADTLNDSLRKLHHSIAQNNTLYLDLQREQEALRVLNETLEQRIAERTQSLSDAKHILAISLQQEKEGRLAQANLLALMAHEVRSPVAVIGNTAQMLNALASTEKPEWLPRLEKIMVAVRQLAHLMDEVLDEDRIALKNSVLERQSGDLNAFCAALQTRQMERHKRAILFEPCAGDVQLNVDWHLIDVAVNNLIDNAIKYSPPDGAISLRVVRGQGDSVSIEIHDQGKVIPPELQSRIFEKFTRGQAEGDGEGVGLGLYLVSWIAQLHGGRAEVVSNTEGNTFRLNLT